MKGARQRGRDHQPKHRIRQRGQREQLHPLDHNQHHQRDLQEGIQFADETWLHVYLAMNPLQDQNPADDAQVSKSNQQQEPEWDIACQCQHDIGADNEHLVRERVKNRAQTRYRIKALCNPSIESISDTGDNEDDKRGTVTTVIQKQNKDRYRADPKKRQ